MAEFLFLQTGDIADIETNIGTLQADLNTAESEIDDLQAATAILEGSKTFNPASLDDGEGETTTVTVTGAALGDFAFASFSLDLQGIMLTAYVSDADTVSVRFQNETTGTINLAEGTLSARVLPAT